MCDSFRNPPLCADVLQTGHVGYQRQLDEILVSVIKMDSKEVTFVDRSSLPRTRLIGLAVAQTFVFSLLWSVKYMCGKAR